MILFPPYLFYSRLFLLIENLYISCPHNCHFQSSCPVSVPFNLSLEKIRYYVYTFPNLFCKVDLTLSFFPAFLQEVKTKMRNLLTFSFHLIKWYKCLLSNSLKTLLSNFLEELTLPTAQGQSTRRLPPPTAGYDSPTPRAPGPPLAASSHFPPPELPKHLSRGTSREHLPDQMKNKIEVNKQQSPRHINPYGTQLYCTVYIVHTHICLSE